MSADTATTTAAVDPTAYGMVADDLIRADRARPDPELDQLVLAAKAGYWEPLSAWFAAVAPQWERRSEMAMELNAALDTDDAWLLRWLREAPEDPAVWPFHCYWLIRLAWQIRTSSTADKVNHEQWRAFHRVLNQLPAAAARVRQISPADPGGLIVHIGIAHALRVPHEEYRDMFADLETLAPNHVGARLSGVEYWLPKWRGSRELLYRYVADTLARAEPGSLLTLVQLRALRSVGSPDPDAKITAYIPTPEVQAAIAAARLDFAEADPAHPFHSRMSHWLSYFLHFSGRHEEAAEHFRLIGGYCGSQPWRYYYNDPKAGFVKVRSATLRKLAEQGRAG